MYVVGTFSHIQHQTAFLDWPKDGLFHSSYYSGLPKFTQLKIDIVTKVDWYKKIVGFFLKKKKKKVKMFSMKNWKYFILIIIKSDWCDVKNKKMLKNKKVRWIVTNENHLANGPYKKWPKTITYLNDVKYIYIYILVIFFSLIWISLGFISFFLLMKKSLEPNKWKWQLLLLVDDLSYPAFKGKRRGRLDAVPLSLSLAALACVYAHNYAHLPIQ